MRQSLAYCIGREIGFDSGSSGKYLRILSRAGTSSKLAFSVLSRI